MSTAAYSAKEEYTVPASLRVTIAVGCVVLALGMLGQAGTRAAEGGATEKPLSPRITPSGR